MASDDSAWSSPHTRAEVPPVPVPPIPANGARPISRRAEPDPLFGRLSRRTLVLIVVGVLALVTVCAVATAMSASNGGRLKQAARVPMPAGNQLRYRAPGDLCQEADFTHLRPTFTTLDDLSSESQDGSGLSVTRCEGATGNDSVQGTFTFVTVVTATNEAARTLFEEERSGVRNWARTSDVAGLGAGAYTALEPAGVVTVHAYDANLTIRLSWAPAHTGDAAPDGTAGSLADTCRSTMALFRN